MLPLRYNDGKKIEGMKFSITYEELVDKFGGCTIDNSPLLGGWIDPFTQKQVKDENTMYWVVCKKTNGNIEFFRKMKKKLKVRFQQKDMMIYYTVVNRI